MVDVQTVFPEGFNIKLKALLDEFNTYRPGDNKKNKNKAKHENYNGCINHAEEMAWHVYGKKPIRLLRRSRPREDPAITKYRIDSYEPITKSICKKALSIVHKIFDPGLHVIKWEKQNTETQVLEDYTLVNYPRFNSVVNYLANYAMKKMVADPNAIFLVQPLDYSIQAKERTQPIATCYHSKDIYLINESYCLLFDDYKQDKQGNRVWYFTYADKTAIYKFKITRATSNDFKIETLFDYQHGFNELPFWYLGGEYTEDADDDYGYDKDDGHNDDEEDSSIFESFFYAAVPFWNEAINDHSDVVGSYRNHMWPHKWEFADECEYLENYEGNSYKCNNGWITYSDGDRHQCPNCGGTGRASAKSPLETTLVSRDKFNEPGPAGGQIPLGYVTVPTDALKMLEEKSERNLEKGLESLNMDVVNEIGLNQSGKAKEMDRTELNDFLQRIADMMFEIHLTNIYYFFTKYMFGITVKDPAKLIAIMPTISKPTQFDIYSTTELTDQFAKSKTAQLNPSYLRVKQAEIQTKEFQNNPDILKRLNLELALDPLAELSSDEVSLKLTNGTITKETAIIHDNISSFIANAIDEDKNFCEKKRSEQMAKMEEYAKVVEEATKIKIDTAAIQALNPPGTPAEKYQKLPPVKV